MLELLLKRFGNETSKQMVCCSRLNIDIPNINHLSIGFAIRPFFGEKFKIQISC